MPPPLFISPLPPPFRPSLGTNETEAITDIVDAARKKSRKNVDRRASKGRKIRYALIEKLSHFMAPQPDAADDNPIANELFTSLFL